MKTQITVRIFDALVREEAKLVSGATQFKKSLVYEVNEVMGLVDLDQLDSVTSPEDLEFRKSVFPKYRFWMRDVLTAGKQGRLTRQEVIDLSTFARAVAVQIIGQLRAEAKQNNLEAQLEDAEATLEQVINDYREANTKANYERSKREEVSKVNLQLVQENAKLRKKISSLKSEVRSQNKTIRVKDQQLKIAKAAILNMANLEQSI